MPSTAHCRFWRSAPQHPGVDVDKRSSTSIIFFFGHGSNFVYPIFCNHAQHLGVDVDKLLLCQPDSGEMALEVADSLIR